MRCSGYPVEPTTIGMECGIECRTRAVNNARRATFERTTHRLDVDVQTIPAARSFRCHGTVPWRHPASSRCGTCMRTQGVTCLETAFLERRWTVGVSQACHRCAGAVLDQVLLQRSPCALIVDVETLAGAQALALGACTRAHVCGTRLLWLAAHLAALVCWQLIDTRARHLSGLGAVPRREGQHAQARERSQQDEHQSNGTALPTPTQERADGETQSGKRTEQSGKRAAVDREREWEREGEREWEEGREGESELGGGGGGGGRGSGEEDNTDLLLHLVPHDRYECERRSDD